ncbi:unnamed protein product [Linum trigynum]|uniref:Uncharacterized protein n=1 Tax=Linum trigynum TaxID=586398 RepID=A0AAV2ESW8_9ROSI
MGRNSTRKVEAEQKAAGEKKAAVVEEPNEVETRQNEKQSEEQQQQPEQPVKTTTEEPQSTTYCKVTAPAKSCKVRGLRSLLTAATMGEGWEGGRRWGRERGG